MLPGMSPRRLGGAQHGISVSALKPYVFAAGGVIIATVLRGALVPLIGYEAPFHLFILCAMVIAFFFGLWPGILGVLVGGLVGDYYFVRPFHTLGPRTATEWWPFLTYLVVANIGVLLIDALRRARRRAIHAARLARTRGEKLEDTIREVGEAEERIRGLAAVVDSAQDPIISVDLEGRVKTWNAGAVRLLGYTAAEMVGQSIMRLVPESRQEEARAHYARLLQEGSAATFESVRTTKDGRVVDVSISLSPLRGAGGKVVGLSAILRDIGARKQAEEEVERLNRKLQSRLDELKSAQDALRDRNRDLELSQQALETERSRYLRLNAELEQRVRERTAALEAANRELEAFSYSVSHDLRAPLRSINGFSRAVLEEYGDKLDEQGSRYLHYAHEASLRMGRLIEDLLELSRVARGELRRRTVDLSALAALVMADLRQAQPDREADVKIAPGLVACGDEGLLRIVLENLLGNAWKFTSKRPNARIEMGSLLSNGRLAYFVKDNGAGFNPQHAARLFGVFQRLHSQDEFPGTGVGLATVKRILARHGGEVWAEGKVEEGATFYFTLPASDLRPLERNGGGAKPASPAAGMPLPQ